MCVAIQMAIHGAPAARSGDHKNTRVFGSAGSAVPTVHDSHNMRQGLRTEGPAPGLEPYMRARPYYMLYSY